MGQKYMVGYQAENMFNILMASNEDHIINTSKNQRRCVVLNLQNTYAGIHKDDSGQKEYFDVLRNTNLQLLTNYFYSMDLSIWNHFQIPITKQLLSSKSDHSVPKRIS